MRNFLARIHERCILRLLIKVLRHVKRVYKLRGYTNFYWSAASCSDSHIIFTMSKNADEFDNFRYNDMGDNKWYHNL